MQAQRLLVAEIVAGAVEADFGDGVERQGRVRNLDAAHAALAVAEHVVVDDQAFQAEAEQRGVHAGRFIDEVEAGEGRP